MKVILTEKEVGIPLLKSEKVFIVLHRSQSQKTGHILKTDHLHAMRSCFVHPLDSFSLETVMSALGGLPGTVLTSLVSKFWLSITVRGLSSKFSSRRMTTNPAGVLIQSRMEWHPTYHHQPPRSTTPRSSLFASSPTVETSRPKDRWCGHRPMMFPISDNAKWPLRKWESTFSFSGGTRTFILESGETIEGTQFRPCQSSPFKKTEYTRFRPPCRPPRHRRRCLPDTLDGPPTDLCRRLVVSYPAL